MRLIKVVRPAALTFAALSVYLGGCATVSTKTEGTSGPIRWRVTDLRLVPRQVEGRTDTTSFTLVIGNAGDRPLSVTRVDRTVYRPGTGPASSSQTVQWELQPGGEREIPFSSFTYCKSYAGCTSRGGTQMLWRVVVVGQDDRNQPIEASIDITLPPLDAGRTPPKR